VIVGCILIKLVKVNLTTLAKHGSVFSGLMLIEAINMNTVLLFFKVGENFY